MHYKNRIVICKSNIYNTSIRKCDRYESNKIWYFFKVLETKTISQVAKDLGFSQSAVSQTIKSLEEELETTLFIRQKRGVILSKDGHAYIPYLKSVQASLDNLRTKKQEMKGVDQVTLRIGTFTSVSRTSFAFINGKIHWNDIQTYNLNCIKVNTQILNNNY